MEQNAKDAGSRRYVLAQIPEPLDPSIESQRAATEYCDKIGRPRTIAELTKERLRRAGVKIKADNPSWQGDTGFRVFKLDTSNIRAWTPKPDDLEATLFDHQDHLLEGRSEADVLYELLLKLGLDLCVPIEKRSIEGLGVHAVGGGVLLACLAEKSPVSRWSHSPKALSLGAGNSHPLAIPLACSATALLPTTWPKPISPPFWSSTAFRTSGACDASKYFSVFFLWLEHAFQSFTGALPFCEADRYGRIAGS